MLADSAGLRVRSWGGDASTMLLDLAWGEVGRRVVWGRSFTTVGGGAGATPLAARASVSVRVNPVV